MPAMLNCPTAPSVGTPVSAGVRDAAVHLLLAAVPECLGALAATLVVSAASWILSRVSRSPRRREQDQADDAACLRHASPIGQTPVGELEPRSIRLLEASAEGAALSPAVDRQPSDCTPEARRRG
ncbi:hypothetical protein GCM10022403_034070 [Streptomyces coacervatus]|uniref:Uncharacterized protein n=1 Tax=Streptomyces coacervatus TaxID=647381 RepID=A0ABP7HK21_9ACTN